MLYSARGGPVLSDALNLHREPWHFMSDNVHHTWAECAAAKSLKTPTRLRTGTGGRPLCPECEAITQAVAKAAGRGEKPPEKPTTT
jgi:hypothetical protein